MKINEEHHLVLKDVYSYDISSCHYNILKRYGFDLSQIDKVDKLKRNTQIGMMMRDNPALISLLRNTTNSLIDSYISENSLTDSQIVLRQYDGLIVLTPLRETNLQGMPIDFRDHFEIFISSTNRRMYIARSSKGVLKVKGVPNKYDELNEFYEKICKINFANKERIFKRLQEIKDEFMSTKSPSLFGIPTSKGKMNVFLKDYGELEIAENTLKVIDVGDIDKNRYFDFYISPFSKSIVIEFVR